MQTQNPFFDDLARMMSGAMGVASGMREEMEARFRQMFENAASRMDLVSREEFEAVKAMAAKAREENEALAKRVAELEKGAKPAARPAAARQGGAKRAGGSAAGKATAKRPAASKAGGSGPQGSGPGGSSSGESGSGDSA